MIKLLELFGGIGACSKALDRLKIEYEIADYVEINKYAVASYNAIHNTNFEPQDITKWDKDIEVDLIMHGSPCQDFSLAGKGAGGDEGSGTRSSLMYETVRIIEKLKPKFVIWENVKALISEKHKHNFLNYIYRLEELGYNSFYQVLNSKDYGIPQNRERIFTVSIRKDIKWAFTFPEKQKLKLKLKDMLEQEVDEKYFLSDKMIDYISHKGTGNFKNPDCKINLDIARPLTTDQNKRAGTTNYLSDDLPSNYDLKEVKRIGGIYDTETKKHQAGSIYDVEGISPTLDTCEGGNRQPNVLIKNKKVRETLEQNDLSNVEDISIIDGYNRKIKNNGIAPTITTGISFRNQDYLLIKNATKQGYLEAQEGDGIDISSRMKHHRGTVQKESCQTLDTQCNVGVVVKDET